MCSMQCKRVVCSVQRSMCSVKCTCAGAGAGEKQNFIMTYLNLTFKVILHNNRFRVPNVRY